MKNKKCNLLISFIINYGKVRSNGFIKNIQRNPLSKKESIFFCKKCSKKLNTISIYCDKCSKEVPEWRLKIETRGLSRKLIKRNMIKKENCSVCGIEKSEAHHPDYNNAVFIVWLCKKHHIEEHIKHRGTFAWNILALSNGLEPLPAT